MKRYYLSISMLAKLVLLNNYAAKLPNYATIFGLTKADTDKVAADATNLQTFFNYVDAQKKHLKYLTSYRSHLMNGDSENRPLPTLTAPPALPTFTVSPVADIFGRLMDQVALIKKNKNATPDILKDLGIDGIEEIAIDTENIRPELKGTLVGGRPVIEWKKNKMDGVHIYVDRGDGKGYGAVPYTDLKPNFDDNFPLPPSGQTAIWKYKAYYIEDDEEIGQVSNEVVITVVGK